MTAKRRIPIVVALALASLGAAPAIAQAPSGAAPPPAAVESAPLPPPGAPPAASPLPAAPPPVTLSQTPPSAAPVPAGRPTLIREPGDASNVDEVTLPEKPVLAASGSSSWDDGLTTLRATFARIEAELRRLGLTPAGRPLAVFTETSDDTFKFDAMVPIERASEAGVAPAAGMRFGATPSGKAYRFVHKGPYEDVDGTYETITTYLDAKDILAKDAFIEEYVDDIADRADPNLEINIFVQPR